MGRLGRPHGLDGYLGLYVDEEDIVHFEPGSHVYVDDRALQIRAIRKADRGYHVAFEGISDRNAAESIRNLDVTVSSRRQLDDDEFWPDDLIGLEVRPGGGLVAGVTFGPSQSRLVIDRAGATFEVPFVEELVPIVDIAAGFVEIVEIEGLSPAEDQ